MSNEVKRYSVRGQFDHGLNLMTTREVVLASDYDALAAELAAIRAEGGEQVEVVAWLAVDEHTGEREIGSDPFTWEEDCDSHVAECSGVRKEPLMTVAQHQRIVAAMAAELERLNRESQNLSDQLGSCDRKRRDAMAELQAIKAQTAAEDKS